MESAALLLSGQEGGNLPLRIAALPVGAVGDQLRIAVWAELESSALESATGSGRHLELAVYALAGAEVRASQLQEFRIPPGPIPESIRLVIDLSLPPGSYSLRVLLRDRSTTGVGLRVLPVEIPAAGATGLFPPLLSAEGSAAPWTLNADGSQPVAAIASIATIAFARAAPRSLARADGVHSLLLPVWHPGTASSLELQVRRPGDAGGRPLRFQSGSEGVDSTAGSELALWPGELQISELAAGDYELAAPGGAALLRVQVSETRAPSARPAAPTTRTSTSKRGAGAAALREYRRALAALAPTAATADSGTGPAAAILAAFEPPALANGSIDPEDLLAIEIGAADPLGRTDPEALLPAIALHLDLYAARRNTGDPGATTHAREMVATLAELYAARGGDRAVAGEALLSLASLLDETSPGLQRRILSKAADLDPSSQLAWRALAVAAERHGDFSHADFYLRRLLEADPDSPEATLRLGIYAARGGQPRVAHKHLRAVIQAEDATPAQRLVAAQEASRAHFEGGEPGRAADAARAGLALEPADEKLRLLLAAALDAQGRRSEAAELLAGVAPAPEPNARWTLTRLPTSALEAIAVSFHERARAAAPALARALAAVAERR